MPRRTRPPAKAKQLSAEVQQKAAHSAVMMESQFADLDGASALSKQLQLARNQQALARWQTYLAELTTAKINSRRQPPY